MPTATHNREPIPDHYVAYVAGDVAVLKTGGPEMVVLDYCEDCDVLEVAYGTGKHVNVLTLPGAAVVLLA